ncbi:hypothetical protein QTP88_013487 [Uroleucon formosanum]
MLAARNVLLLLVAGSFIASSILALPQDKESGMDQRNYQQQRLKDRIPGKEKPKHIPLRNKEEGGHRTVVSKK